MTIMLKKEQHSFETEISNFINAFTVTFNQLNAALLNKSINLFTNLTFLNGSVHMIL